MGSLEVLEGRLCPLFQKCFLKKCLFKATHEVTCQHVTDMPWHVTKKWKHVSDYFLHHVVTQKSAEDMLWNIKHSCFISKNIAFDKWALWKFWRGDSAPYSRNAFWRNIFSRQPMLWHGNMLLTCHDMSQRNGNMFLIISCIMLWHKN